MLLTIPPSPMIKRGKNRIKTESHYGLTRKGHGNEVIVFTVSSFRKMLKYLNIVPITNTFFYFRYTVFMNAFWYGLLI